MDKKLLKTILFAAAAGILFGVGKLTHLFEGLEKPTFNFSWGLLLEIGVFIAAALAVSNVLLFLLGRVNPRTKRVRTAITIVESLMKYIVWLVIIFGILTILNVDIRTIVAGLGVVALIIGYGADSLIADIATGIFLLMENQYNVGDIIEVGGFRGEVAEIGIRTTTLIDSSGNRLIINNSKMSNILNRSSGASHVPVDFTVKGDPEVIEELLPRITEGFEAEYQGIQQMEDDVPTVRFRLSADEEDIYRVQREFKYHAYRVLKEAGVSVSYK
jgi:small conductance mechanosensitive channel